MCRHRTSEGAGAAQAAQHLLECAPSFSAVCRLLAPIPLLRRPCPSVWLCCPVALWTRLCRHSAPPSLCCSRISRVGALPLRSQPHLLLTLCVLLCVLFAVDDLRKKTHLLNAHQKIGLELFDGPLVSFRFVRLVPRCVFELQLSPRVALGAVVWCSSCALLSLCLAQVFQCPFAKQHLGAEPRALSCLFSPSPRRL